MLFIVQFATISFFVHLATAMRIKFFQYPNCIQQMYTSYAFSDICTSGQPLSNSYDLALTTCVIDKTGNGTITATTSIMVILLVDIPLRRATILSKLTSHQQVGECARP